MFMRTRQCPQLLPAVFPGGRGEETIPVFPGTEQVQHLFGSSCYLKTVNEFYILFRVCFNKKIFLIATQ